MNLTAMKTSLKRFGFDDSDPLTDWLNFAMHETADYYPWPFLMASTTNVSVNASGELENIPNDFLKIASLVDHSGAQTIKLKQVDYTWFEREVLSPTTTGNPELYAVRGDFDDVVVYPVPTTNDWVMRYLKTLPDLVSDNDVPGLPQAFHFPIVLRAAATGHEAENEEDRAQSKLDQWEAAVVRKIQKYSNSTRGEARQVTDTQGYS